VFRHALLALLCWCALLPAQVRSSSAEALSPDPGLSRQLEALIGRMGLQPEIAKHKMAVSLVDVTDESKPRYAGVNDTVMMYAASLPKIAILLAGFEEIHQGKLRDTPEVRGVFTRMTRYSSNADATRAVHMIGFESIAKTLTSPKYRLYDPKLNGGLWVGKAYGGPHDRWRRDPLHHLSHGATTLQTARFFTLLSQGRLVDAETSREMKEILSHPGIRHKFVKGLAGLRGVKIYRKSGTWKNWHADAALIEHGEKRYVAAALVENPRGGKILEELIRGLDRIICGSPGGARLD